jgi:membrane fusion protein
MILGQVDTPDHPSLPLFREEVLQARSWMGRITLSEPVSSWLLATLAFAFAAAVLVFLFVATYTRHESVQGQLVPSSGLLPVTARSAGTVTRTLVREGESVKKDQSLIELSGEVSSLSRGQTQGSVIVDLQAQLKEIEGLLENQKRLEDQQQEGLNNRVAVLQQQLVEIARQFSTQEEQTNIAERRVEKLRPGVTDGTFSQVEFERYQAEALTGRTQLNVLSRQRLDTEQQLRTLQNQLQEVPLTIESQRNELRFRLSAINQALAQNEAQRASVLRAPRDGVVASLAIQDGQTVGVGQRLLSILPEGSLLQAELWLPSRAVGFIETGNRVVLRYPAFPYQKFGQQDGRVLEVSRSATAASELTGLLGRTISEPLYRVVVRLDQQAVSAYGKPEALKPGMTVDADILLDRRRLIEWVLEPLYGASRSFKDPQSKPVGVVTDA